MAAFIGELVRIPTENPPGRCYESCVDLLAGRMRTLGLSPAVIEIPLPDAGLERRFAVTGSLGSQPRTLYFHGHYDVVPAGDETQFVPTMHGDTMFGRGTADMKGGLAAMMYAAHALAECGVRLEGRVALMFVPDEETGGRLGSRYLTDAGHLGQNGIGMLTAEPTSGVVWNANRGAISLLVTVTGRPAHVGLQHLGVNAFERMLVVTDLLRALKADVETRRTGFALEPDAARSSILMLGGRTEGGTNFNVVPADCRFTVDRRLNPEEDLETEKQRLFSVFDQARAQGIFVDVEVLQEGRPSGVGADHEAALALAASINDVTGKPPVFEMCPGLLETRFYAERGVPAFAYGPGLLSVAHGPKEFVKLDAVLDCATIYALTASRLLSDSPV